MATHTLEIEIETDHQLSESEASSLKSVIQHGSVGATVRTKVPSATIKDAHVEDSGPDFAPEDAEMNSSSEESAAGREERKIKRIRQVALNLMWSGLKRRSEKPDAVYIVDTALAHIRDRFSDESLQVSALKITGLIDRIQTDMENQTRRPPGHGESQFNIYPDKDKWDIDEKLLSRPDQPDS